ncbi:NADP-dependent 3-hydroxy acid dehydrogenase YdfG [Pontibacter ummariensis]|uniref:NADP-dependent 3-hydroxy acid dehydrogenase YdfG n=1 Tax=Pontibacter ummariensis TaxID=1610492 RepID=A0A239GGU0_9BACT|nr:short chain dehydrogenase [Pontibacter ummariensis]PRY11261.1 NADP-dependent 3-hydroxy acid dehydrogenase YdfG [Pontibacter ummariensis]SNS68359.1 NADP-dependent 3-hydroxy acid dehydrogenase YdfG [Pontibacter ummariensis]
MKILFVGGTGTIGKKVTAKLQEKHELVLAGSRSGDVQFDMTDYRSIEGMFQKIGKVDALVVAAGGAYMGPLAQLTEEHFYQGIRSKMMGQINLVLVGQHYLNNGGSITLTSGILSEDPIANGTVLSAINNAVNGFVVGAAGELLQRGIRINVVSPGLVEDSAEAIGSYFPGHNPVPMDRVVNGYIKSIEGIQTGQVIKVY